MTAQTMLDAAATRLSEHFSSVQIVTSRLMPDGTTEATFAGSGDWYARKALCMAFVESDQAYTIARAIQDT